MKAILSFFLSLTYLFLKFYWFLFRPRSSGIKVLIKYKDEILLVKHTYGRKFWTAPGGALRPNETPEAAARREVKEELDLDINQIANHGSFLYTGEYKKDTIWVMSAKVNQKTSIKPNFEIKQVQWFKTNALSNLSSSVLRSCLELTNS